MDIAQLVKKYLVHVCVCLLLLAEITHSASAENLTPLPKIVTPNHYQLTLLPILEDSPRLCGHVWIDVTARMETNMIILHATDLAIVKAVVLALPADNESSTLGYDDERQTVEDLCFTSSVFYGDTSNERNIADNFFQDGAKELMTITLTEGLKSGGHYRIGILYNGVVFDTGNKGFFRSKYEAGNRIDCCKRIIGATQLEAIHARKVFPCIDEPAYKATFQVTVGHASTMSAINNMPLKFSTQMITVENWIWDTFDTSPPMATYLLACVVSELSYVETWYQSISGQNVTIRLWTQSHTLKKLDFAADLVPKVMYELEKYLLIPYSLPKLDIVVVPGYDEGKAMENWGLIVHSEESLLVDDVSDNIDRALIAVTTVHELAHQWFGNLVTSSWWDDIWVNEGLTTLYENIMLKQVNSKEEYETVMIVFLQEVLRTDQLVGSHPLSEPVSRYASIDDKFDPITYSKGAAIFRMVKSFVGDEAFQSAIRRYLNKYQYGIANSTDFWNIVNQEARRTYSISGRMNVGRIMKTWTQQPGYPLVYVHRSKNGIMHISQRPFRNSDVPPDNATMVIAASWWVPVSIVDADGHSFTTKDRLPVVWLSPRKPSMEIEGPKGINTWVVANVEASGYYRVNYDRRNWELLADQLWRNYTAIPYISRAQLVDDAFSLGHAKVISYDIAVQLIRYLARTDEESLIRRIVKAHIEYIQTVSEKVMKTSEKERLVRGITSYVTRDRKSRTAKTFNSATGACDANERSCAVEASQMIQAYQKSATAKDITKFEMSESMWCAAIRHSNKEEWALAWNMTRSSNLDDSANKKILKAMCCTTDPINVKRLLTRVLHPTVKQHPKETSLILNQLIKNSFAREIALRFIISNWVFLNKHFPNHSVLLNLLTAVAKNSYSSEELEKVKAFLSSTSNGLETREVDRVLSAVNTSLRLLELQQVNVDKASLFSDENFTNSTAL